MIIDQVQNQKNNIIVKDDLYYNICWPFPKKNVIMIKDDIKILIINIKKSVMKGFTERNWDFTWLRVKTYIHIDLGLNTYTFYL